MAINFDKEFEKGVDSYNGKVGKWWEKQANSLSHTRAYNNIASYLQKLFRKPKLIIDYACGNGKLLLKLAQTFPQSQLLGLDGSSYMLGKAYDVIKKQAHRMHFIETTLPNFSLPKERADLIVFCFPNIVPHPDEQPYYDKNGYKNKDDVAVAKWLAKAREEDPEEETVTDDEETLLDTLLTNKVISRNIRSLIKKGGYCVRVEYANAPREELTKLVRWRTMFEEGSLDTPMNGKKAEQLFKVVKTEYFNSKVIEDVYHQTNDEDDKEGGYYVVLLKAV